MFGLPKLCRAPVRAHPLPPKAFLGSTAPPHADLGCAFDVPYTARANARTEWPIGARAPIFSGSFNAKSSEIAVIFYNFAQFSDGVLPIEISLPVNFVSVVISEVIDRGNLMLHNSPSIAILKQMLL